MLDFETPLVYAEEISHSLGVHAVADHLRAFKVAFEEPLPIDRLHPPMPKKAGTTITETRKSELIARGFMVEDMRVLWGDLYKGRYRWVLNGGEDRGSIQFGEESAWADADQYGRLRSS